MIPLEIVEKIKSAANILEVVESRGVKLKKRGGNYVACCPFHNEKTASFSVNVSKNICKCFGCGVGGDPVQFLIQHDGVSYPEALRILAEMNSIEIVDRELTTEEEEAFNREKTLKIVSAKVNEFFINSLMKSGLASRYLSDRGITQETIKFWEIGYAPDYYKFLKSAGWTDKVLLEAGLVTERGYPRFQGRLIFPIENHNGEVIGFGGRIIEPDPKAAKYVNSPETAIYHKSNVLFGLSKAKKEIDLAGEALVLEGYMDVVSLWQFGIRNTVAASGTSFTVEQAKLIRRFTKNVTLLFDGDKAGNKAITRSIPILLAEGLRVHVVTFPENQDPDSLVQEIGRESFLLMVASTKQDWISYHIQKKAEECRSGLTAKAEAAAELVQLVSTVKTSVEAGLYIKYICQQLEIDEFLLFLDYRKLKP